MKNIHVLPTDKQSKVLYNSTFKSFCIQKEIDGMFINDGKVSGADFWGLEKALNNNFRPQNIYITSDEEIKEGDWYIDTSVFKENIAIDRGIYQMKYFKWGIEGQGDCKKIILTTDQDLIADGVQVIDDEFLEWFVKNPSCEEVETGTYHIKGDISGKLHYKIIIPKEVDVLELGQIIPKEEPKQDRTCNNNCSVVCGECQIFKPKQETLEEAATKYLHSVADGKRYTGYADEDFINGAKWQADKVFNDDAIQTLEKALAILLKRQESMYSEKEVELIANEMVNWAIDNVGNPNPQSGRKFDEVISKFKKK